MNDPYTKLAKYTIEEFVRTGKIIEVPKNLPEEMINKKAGAFVSLHKRRTTQTGVESRNNAEEGELRGCIGTFQPTKKNIAQEIIDNAIAASSHDPRFSPVTKDEFENLEISVDVLEKPEPIATSDLRLAISNLDPKKYGVIVKSATDSRTGLLLPDIVGVDTPEYQIAIARQKAGILPDEEIHLYRFEVIRHK